jgi:hypothetical protein
MGNTSQSGFGDGGEMVLKCLRMLYEVVVVVLCKEKMAGTRSFNFEGAQSQLQQ